MPPHHSFQCTDACCSSLHHTNPAYTRTSSIPSPLDIHLRIDTSSQSSLSIPHHPLHLTLSTSLLTAIQSHPLVQSCNDLDVNIWIHTCPLYAAECLMSITSISPHPSHSHRQPLLHMHAQVRGRRIVRVMHPILIVHSNPNCNKHHVHCSFSDLIEVLSALCDECMSKKIDHQSNSFHTMHSPLASSTRVPDCRCFHCSSAFCSICSSLHSSLTNAQHCHTHPSMSLPILHLHQRWRIIPSLHSPPAPR